jgi:hypothetical protein
LPTKGFKVITVREEVIEKARSVFERRRSELPSGTSFSNFVGDLIIAQVKTMEENLRDLQNSGSAQRKQPSISINIFYR